MGKNTKIYNVFRLAASLLPVKVRRHMRNEICCAITRLRVSNIYKRYRNIYLEIGSGPKAGTNGWLTLDVNFDADIYWDLNKKLPFIDNSVSMIYSSHVLEHFCYEGLINLLKDCHRVLKSGGQFSACVPNARLYLQVYFDPGSFDSYKRAVYSELPIDTINYIAYMDGHHKYMFDEENLVHILRTAGFSLVRLREFDPDIDMVNRKYESIYVHCVKS